MLPTTSSRSQPDWAIGPRECRNSDIEETNLPRTSELFNNVQPGLRSPHAKEQQTLCARVISVVTSVFLTIHKMFSKLASYVSDVFTSKCEQTKEEPTSSFHNTKDRMKELSTKQFPLGLRW